jgi:hypothetical protein
MALLITEVSLMELLSFRYLLVGANGLFVGFNRASGINVGIHWGPDQVLVHRSRNNENEISFLLANLLIGT